MSITKYQIFLKTAACGSFSKAAEAMNFTQSGISHAINSLEAGPCCPRWRSSAPPTTV